MRKRSLLLGVPAIGAALLLAACGSSSSGGTSTSAAPSSSTSASSTGSDVVAAAQAEVDKAKAVPSTTDLGKPIDVKSLAGKTIYSIPIDSKLEFYQVGENAMKAIAEKAGLKYVTFPSDGTPTSFQQGIAQAIAAKAGAILLNGPLPENLAPQIADATAAGIPVIPLHLSDSSAKPREITPWEAYAPFNEAIKLATLYSVVDLKGAPIKALVIEASGTGPSAGMVQTIKDTLASSAPAGSTVAAEINSQVPQWSTEIQPAVQSALLKDPTINAVIPIYDSMALFAIPGITQAASDRGIGVYSFNGTPAVMKLIPDGIMKADLAENPDWVAYVNLDTAFRGMLKADPIPGVSGPLRLIDASNVAETGNPPESGKGFGSEYPGAYMKLWGLA